jgi:hypothetical protein
MCSFSNINVPPPATVADLLMQSKNHSSNFSLIINVSTSIAVECNSRTTAFGVSHVPPKILRIRVKIFVGSERVEACGRHREGNSYNWLLNEGARNHLYEISNKRFHRRLLDTIHAGPAIFQSIIERGANRLTVKSPIDSQLASCWHFICADIAKLLFETLSTYQSENDLHRLKK